MSERLDASISKAEIEALSETVENFFRLSISNSSVTSIFEPLQKDVKKRVPPSSLQDWLIPDRLPTLVSIEIQSICYRIQMYPYTARYREHINTGPRDMVQAWILHSHSLRQGELYIILERGCELLKFLRSISLNFGISSSDEHKSFEKSVKKHFARRLRERHRIVHGHERPSMTSRFIDLSSALGTDTSAESARVFMTPVFLQLLSLISAIHPDGPTDDPGVAVARMKSLVENYGAVADREAFDMLKILRTYIAKTLPSLQLEPM